MPREQSTCPHNWTIQRVGKNRTQRWICSLCTMRKSHFVIGAEPSDIVDHINGITLDDSPDNLRICSQSQNCMNKRGSRTGTSKYKGVDWNKNSNKWRARINEKSLGYFATEVDAARAYNEAALRLFGEFARLNVIREESNASQTR